MEGSDLLSYLVLETSFYTNKQFKAFKSLEAFNQMVSGFVTSVVGKVIAGKYVVRARVRHSQRMNDPLVNIWIIFENDGTILSAHCLGCKAGLAESCSHIASVLFYLEATTRIHGKLACTQVKYALGFCRHTSMRCRMLGLRTSIFHRLRSSKKSSTRKLRIYNSRKPRTIQQLLVLVLHRPAHQRLSARSAHRRLRKRNWISSMPNSTSTKLKQ